ncbi:MAG: AbrB/MazE/SpoVT family DNA-binding domain-containing protein [Candidatus Heimdallarchaeota archaeon]|nr:AbrB/MazE/SpoVT family DNA-binding domain-containing protein [Candidatus Heimdallarchaeota archaeon]
MKIKGFAKITSKGQITIPKEVRESMNLERGDYLVFLEDEEGLIYLTKELEEAVPKKD